MIQAQEEASQEPKRDRKFQSLQVDNRRMNKAESRRGESFEYAPRFLKRDYPLDRLLIEVFGGTAPGNADATGSGVRIRGGTV